jgi:hypothetical protein
MEEEGCSAIDPDSLYFEFMISKATASSSSFTAAKSLNSCLVLHLNSNSCLAFRLMKNDLKKDPD